MEARQRGVSRMRGGVVRDVVWYPASSADHRDTRNIGYSEREQREEVRGEFRERRSRDERARRASHPVVD